MTPEKAQRMAEVDRLFSEGKNRNEIAAEMGLCHGTVDSYLREKNITGTTRHHETIAEKIYMLKQSGMSPAEISIELGMKIQTVRNHLSKAMRMKKVKCEKCNTTSVRLYPHKGQKICEKCLCPDYQPTIFHYGHSSLANAEY